MYVQAANNRYANVEDLVNFVYVKVNFHKSIEVR